MGGWKSRPKLCRWGRLALAETRGTKQIQSKEEGSHIKRRGERCCKKKTEQCCWREEIFMTHSWHKKWELWWTKQKQKEEESINLYRLTITLDTLTFVTCIMGLLDRTVTLGDTADPVFLSFFRNVQEPTHRRRRTTVESNDLPPKRTDKVQRCKGYRRCYFMRFVDKVLQSINLTKRPKQTQCVSPSLNTFRVLYNLCGSPKLHFFLLKGYIYKNRS